jgi:hypothetical protein
MYLNRFTSTYTNGIGPRLATGGVDGAYGGHPDMTEIARTCGYPVSPTSVWVNEETGGLSMLGYVVAIAVGVALGMMLVKWAKD